MKPLEALRALGTGGDAPLEAKQRVQAALMASMSAAAAATATAAATQSATLPSASAPLLVGLTGGKLLAIAGAIWLFGGATGAALYGALLPREVRVVYVDRPLLSGSVAAPTPTTAPTLLPVAPASSGSSGSGPDIGAKRAIPTPFTPGSDLAHERALLDLARADAARGAPALVLDRTQRHRAQFPHGKLAEEREALAIRALLSLGRANEARTRARAFHLAYPNSLLAPAIDSALSLP